VIRRNQKPFNMYFPEDVLSLMQKRANELGMSTSGLIRTICTEYVTGKQIIHREPQPVAAVPEPVAQ
jgi:hypothetical protein